MQNGKLARTGQSKVEAFANHLSQVFKTNSAESNADESDIAVT